MRWMREVSENMQRRWCTICRPVSVTIFCIMCSGMSRSRSVRKRRGLSQLPIEWFGSQINCQAPGFVQRAVDSAKDELSVVEMGGASTASSESRVTEAAVRGFWKAYRAQMAL